MKHLNTTFMLTIAFVLSAIGIGVGIDLNSDGVVASSSILAVGAAFGVIFSLDE